MGGRVERDLHFEPTPIGDIEARGAAINASV